MSDNLCNLLQLPPSKKEKKCLLALKTGEQASWSSSLLVNCKGDPSYFVEFRVLCIPDLVSAAGFLHQTNRYLPGIMILPCLFDDHLYGQVVRLTPGH